MSIIIRLQNLPWSANSLDIRRFFNGLSIPEGGVHIVGGEMGDAFIAFSTDEDARLAMAKDCGKIKDMQIKLLLSSRTEMMRVIEQARQQNMVVISQPHVVPTPTPVQQPARMMPAPSEGDRRRGRSPATRHRSRDRSPVRDRRRSPEERRSSKRDRSRSPGRSSRSFSRDMDRRSDRFKRDDRRYDDSRYRDDRRSSARDPSGDSKKYSDADHVNSKSQLHSTEGFRDMQQVYDVVQNIAIGGVVPYGSQQLPLQHSSAKNITDSYLRPSSDSPAQLSQERSMPQKPVNILPMGDQKHSSSSTMYPHEQVPFRSAPFEQSAASTKESSAADQQHLKSRRRSRFEPEFVPPSNKPPFPITDSNVKVPNIQNQSSAYSINRAPHEDYSESRRAWSQEMTNSSQNVTWNEKRQPLLNPPVTASGDFLQVVPMDLDPPDMSPEPETYNENLPSGAPFPYGRSTTSLRNDDPRRDNQTREPLMHNSNQNRGPSMHNDNHNRGPPIHIENQNRGPPMHIENQNRGPPMHIENQNRRPPMHIDNRNRGLPMHNDDPNRGVPIHYDEPSRRPPLHDSNIRGPLMGIDGPNKGSLNIESSNRGAPMQNDSQNRGPPRHSDSQNRGSLMHSDSQSRGPLMQNDSPIRGPLMQSDSPSRGPLMQSDSLNMGPPMQNDSQIRGPPIHVDRPNRGPPMHSDTQIRGPQMHSDSQNRRSPMHSDSQLKGPQVQSDNQIRGPQAHSDSQNRVPPIQNDSQNREPPIHTDSQNRGPPMHVDSQIRGPPMRSDNQNRGPPIHSDSQNRGPSIHTESQNRGPPIRNESQNRGLPIQSDSQNIGPPMHSDSQNRGPPIHSDNQSRGPPMRSDSQKPMHSDSQNRVPLLHGDNQSRVPPMHTDSTNRGSPVHIDNQGKVPPSLTVEVRGLPPDARIEDVLDLVRGISLPAANIRIEANDQGFEKAFIRFISIADFEEALSRNRRFMHERRCELVPCPASEFDGAARPQKPKSRARPREDDLTIQMRGLPFSCKEDDIIKFFDGLAILDLYIQYSDDGRATGTGFTEFGSHKDFRAALAMNGKMICHRYITISVASKELMTVSRGKDYIPKDTPLNAPKPDSSRPPMNLDRPPSNQNRPPVPQGRQPPSCIFMKGLPEGVTNGDIADFLGQAHIMPRAIHIMLRQPDKMPSGDAYAEFPNRADMETALDMDGKMMLDNCVEIKPISFFEMSEILGKPVNVPPPLPPGGLLRTPSDMDRPRRPLLIQGHGEGPPFRERLRMEPPIRGGRPMMDPSGRPPFGPGRMRGPWPNRPRHEGRFPPPHADRGPKDFGSPGCVVSINNLHFRAGLEEILDFFQGYNITKDNVIRKYNENGQTTGEARVAFQNPRDALRVVRELNQKPIMGRPLTLSIL